MARRAARTDGNHSEIIKAFEVRGASVRSVHQVPGALDLIVGFRGIDQRVEVKDGSRPPSERKLTEAEFKEIHGWNGRYPMVVESIAEVEYVLREMAADAALLAGARCVGEFSN